MPNILSTAPTPQYGGMISAYAHDAQSYSSYDDIAHQAAGQHHIDSDKKWRQREASNSAPFGEHARACPHISCQMVADAPLRYAI